MPGWPSVWNQEDGRAILDEVQISEGFGGSAIRERDLRPPFGKRRDMAFEILQLKRQGRVISGHPDLSAVYREKNSTSLRDNPFLDPQQELIKKLGDKFPFQVETTRPSTAEREGRKWPIRLRRNNSMEPGRTWIFTDGGGGGRFAAAIVRPCIEEYRTGRREINANSAVAELDGVIPGLENTVLGERVTIVSDYLWTAYYINGWWKAHHACLREGVIRARKVVEGQELKDVAFVHYGEENEDDECEFSKWNMIAHDLCQEGSQLKNRTRMTPRSAIPVRSPVTSFLESKQT